MTLQELLIEEVGFIVIPHFLVVHSQHIRKTGSHLTALVHIGPVEHFRPILTGICRLAKQTHRIVISESASDTFESNSSADCPQTDSGHIKNKEKSNVKVFIFSVYI